MERKIGEIFKYGDKTLQVKESASNGCDGCFFDEQRIPCSKNVSGYCEFGLREDKKEIIFVEVQEQPQETEEGRERRIGEVFEYDGKKLKVVEGENECDKCYFYNNIYCTRIDRIAGACLMSRRIDNKSVKFVEVTEEHETQQAEQPKLNLCEILKNCPEGTELWSDNYGIVKFVNVATEWDTPIRVKLTNGFIARYTEEGWCDKRFPANCLLWPSRDCRDWSKFTAPWPKKEKFDPKTLRAFDRVITRNKYDEWTCTLFSHIGNKPNTRFIYVTCESVYEYCIPYNDETKHLVGTKDEAPDFYKYWED